MKIVPYILNTVMGFSVMLALAGTFQPSTASAGVAVPTCFAFTTVHPLSNVYFVVNRGQTLTISSDGSSFTSTINNVPNGTSTGPIVFTASVADTIFGITASASGTVTVQCADVGVGPPTPEEIKDKLSGLLVIQQDSHLVQSVGEAVTDGFGNGDSAPFISENAFSISTRGLAALASRETSKKTLTAQVKEKIYGANVNFDNVPEQSSWNVWASGRYDYFDGDSFDGGLGTVNAGVDYGFSENFLLGAVIGYGRADIDVGATGKLEARSYTLGTYFGAKLGGTVMADGFAAYTKSDYDVTAGITTGQFDAIRLSTGINIYGSVVMDGLTIQPGISFTYGSEKQDAYVDSTATAVASQTIKSGRLSIGPKFTFNAIETKSGSLSPWIATRFEHNFSNANNAANTNLPDVANNNSGRLSAGFTTDFGSGTFSFSGDVGGLGSRDYISYGGTTKFRIPLQ